MPANLENSAMATALEKSVFIPITKKGKSKECSNHHTVSFISNAFKVILKILQARLQQYMNCELPAGQAGNRKGRGTRDQIANIRWIIEKESQFQKNIYFCFIDYAKTFDCVDDIKLWTFLKEMGKPDHLTGFLRNMYAGQEETARTGHGTTDRFLIGKDYGNAVYFHPAHLTYVQSTYKIPSLDEGQVGIKIARRNIKNLRYADDTTPMAESAEELNSLLIKVRVNHLA